MSEGWFRSVIGEICVFLCLAVNSSDWWTSLVFNRQTANSGFTDEISNREHDCSWSVFLDKCLFSKTFLIFLDLSNKRKAWKDETRARRKTRVTKNSKKYLLRGLERGFLVCSHLQQLFEKKKFWDKVDKRPIFLLSAGNTCVSILRSCSSERGERNWVTCQFSLSVMPHLHLDLAFLVFCVTHLAQTCLCVGEALFLN